jgi:hypothetical protein
MIEKLTGHSAFVPGGGGKGGGESQGTEKRDELRAQKSGSDCSGGPGNRICADTSPIEVQMMASGHKRLLPSKWGRY